VLCLKQVIDGDEMSARQADWLGMAVLALIALALSVGGPFRDREIH
jgi:hypothetical protein